MSTDPRQVGMPAPIGGQMVESGDMMVADRDGVVVVPFAMIDAVAAKLQAVRAAEEALDAQLAGGLKYPDGVANLVEGEDVVFV